MAPEVIQGQKYDGRCDWWSIGIILYECLYGHTPFLSEQGRRETKQNIIVSTKVRFGIFNVTANNTQDHKKRFYFPQRPEVSERCKDLIYRMIQAKEDRLCSKRYQRKDRHVYDQPSTADVFGRYVFPDDAEDIKAHRWFRSIQWDRLHTRSPPLIPYLRGPEDTRYFDESDSIDDMSDSMAAPVALSLEAVRDILHGFRPSFQNLAAQLVSKPYDSIKLRGIDQRIDHTPKITATEKEVLKQFVRMYGQKERRRPRDQLLRDETTKDVAMDVRKRTAFLGYTWRRMRPEGYRMVNWVV
jgi:serine/threonine protein kinase